MVFQGVQQRIQNRCLWSPRLYIHVIDNDLSYHL